MRLICLACARTFDLRSLDSKVSEAHCPGCGEQRLCRAVWDSESGAWRKRSARDRRERRRARVCVCGICGRVRKLKSSAIKRPRIPFVSKGRPELGELPAGTRICFHHRIRPLIAEVRI